MREGGRKFSQSLIDVPGLGLEPPPRRRRRRHRRRRERAGRGCLPHQDRGLRRLELKNATTPVHLPASVLVPGLLQEGEIHDGIAMGLTWDL